MKNALMLGRIDWKRVSENSSLAEIHAAMSQTQEVLSANRVTLEQYKIEIPESNSMFTLKKFEQIVTTR